jgi:riboflavin kinase / FMN adenylyltransferase
MEVMTGVAGLSAAPEGCVVTIGTFDGVHLGHRALIAGVVSEARRRGLPAAAVTWDRHPLQTLRPEAAPPLLTSPARKIELLGETGLDHVAVLPFDREFSTWSPERFVREVLVEGLAARAVYVGEGWRFGKGASGDVALLGRLGEELGFEASGVDLERDATDAVSSSRIRAAVARGDIEVAESLLGRPFDLDGLVVRGDGRGKGLGWPTANLALEEGVAVPAAGVYAARARIDRSWLPAAVNVGVNPTFGEGTPLRVEAHLLDFEGDVYGRTLRIAFVRRLRDEKRFERVDDLVEQIGRDVEETRRLIAGTRGV